MIKTDGNSNAGSTGKTDCDQTESCQKCKSKSNEKKDPDHLEKSIGANGYYIYRSTKKKSGYKRSML